MGIRKRFAARHFLGLKEAPVTIPRDLDTGLSPALEPRAPLRERVTLPVPNRQRALKGGVSRAVIGFTDQPSDERGFSGDHRLSPAILRTIPDDVINGPPMPIWVEKPKEPGFDGGGGPPPMPIPAPPPMPVWRKGGDK